MILLFPDEWHTYAPDESGWYEHWVGFKGDLIECWISNRFFSKEKPVYEIGVNATIISLYEEIVTHAVQEKSGYQQLISSIVLYLMGEIYYKEKNLSKEELQKEMETIVSEVNKNLVGYKKIEKVTLVDKPMEMTTTKKIKRNLVK